MELRRDPKSSREKSQVMITLSGFPMNKKNNAHVCFKKLLPANGPRCIHQCRRSLRLSDSVSAYEMEHLQKLPESM